MRCGHGGKVHGTTAPHRQVCLLARLPRPAMMVVEANAAVTTSSRRPLGQPNISIHCDRPLPVHTVTPAGPRDTHKEADSPARLALPPHHPPTMQRIDPRPEAPPQSTTPPPQSQNNQSQAQQAQGQASQFMPTGFASTGANPHTQSFEEIYGIPENFLEIEVRERGRACRWSTRAVVEGGAYTYQPAGGKKDANKPVPSALPEHFAHNSSPNNR